MLLILVHAYSFNVAYKACGFFKHFNSFCTLYLKLMESF